MPNKTKIPAATILRLSIYHRYLQHLLKDGTEVVSSAELANHTNVNPAQLRKDLSYFGRFGVRGVGYDVSRLIGQIRNILGLEKEWNMALIGAGNIGRALLQHKQFESQGYRFVAALDKDPRKVGEEIAPGLVVSPIEILDEIMRTKEVDLAVIAVPASEAQWVAEQVVAAGIKGILNFAPVRLKVPKDVAVQHVDFTVLLDTLTYAVSTGDNSRQVYHVKHKKGWSRTHSWPITEANYV